MNIISESRPVDGVAGRQSSGRRRDIAVRRHGAWAAAIGCIVALLALDGCAPPTEVVDLRNAPWATQDAMLRIMVLPLGAPAPYGVGSISPISGYGCASTSEAASGAAIRQIRVKAMGLHATAVVDVLVGPADSGICFGGYNMIANGIAVGPRAIPSAY